MRIPVIYELPITVSGLLIILFLSACVELSYRIGKWQLSRGRGATQDTRGDSILAAMLGMLALVLAFTYSYTVTRADNRKQAVVNQINALGTAFDRAGLVKEPYRTQIRRQLADYTALLYIDETQVNTPAKLQQVISDINDAESPIWPTVENLVTHTNRPGPTETTLATSINEVLDAKNQRLHAGLDRLPEAILGMLIFIAAATLSVAGYSAGRADNMKRWRMIALTLSIAAIMQVITDFDRPGSGLIRTDQTGFERLEAQMRLRLEETQKSAHPAEISTERADL